MEKTVISPANAPDATSPLPIRTMSLRCPSEVNSEAAMKSTHLLSVVLLVSIFGCSGDEARISATMNESATLVGELPANPLQWKVITSAVNPEASTMSTPYGNDLPPRYARTKPEHDYPTAPVLSL